MDGGQNRNPPPLAAAERSTAVCALYSPIMHCITLGLRLSGDERPLRRHLSIAVTLCDHAEVNSKSAILSDGGAFGDRLPPGFYHQP